MGVDVDGGAAFAVRIGLITALLIVSGISSQVSFWAMGQVMTGYPSFLLYFCNGLYALGYLVILVPLLLWRITTQKKVAGSLQSAALLSPSGEGKRVTSWGADFFGGAREQRFFLVRLATPRRPVPPAPPERASRAAELAAVGRRSACARACRWS